MKKIIEYIEKAGFEFKEIRDDQNIYATSDDMNDPNYKALQYHIPTNSIVVLIGNLDGEGKLYFTGYSFGGIRTKKDFEQILNVI